MLDKVIETSVDEDILDFLKYVYFGDFSNPIEAASRRAYLDMNRTLRLKPLPDDVRLMLRRKVNSIFAEELSKLSLKEIPNQDSFDSWHQNVSNQMRKIYLDNGGVFTYGHAQKWLNMTIKYLYMLEATSFDEVFEYLHVPLDNYVFDIASSNLGLERPKQPWSRWDDYDHQYLAYQKAIRERISEGSPLRWEFRYWLRAVQGIEKD